MFSSPWPSLSIQLSSSLSLTLYLLPTPIYFFLPHLSIFSPKLSRLDAVCWKWMGNKIDSNKHLFPASFSLFFERNLTTTTTTKVLVNLPSVYRLCFEKRPSWTSWWNERARLLLLLLFGRLKTEFWGLIWMTDDLFCFYSSVTRYEMYHLFLFRTIDQLRYGKERAEHSSSKTW